MKERLNVTTGCGEKLPHLLAPDKKKNICVTNVHFVVILVANCRKSLCRWSMMCRLDSVMADIDEYTTSPAQLDWSFLDAADADAS